MPKELYLKIDDDVARAVAKIQRANSSELTLVLPKGAMLLSNVINLKLLKKQIDLMGKQAFILTMDGQGQYRAMEAGFELLTFDMMRKGIRPEARSLPVRAPKPSPVVEPVAMPIFSRATDFERDILTQAPKTILESKKPKPLKIREARENSGGRWIPFTILSLVILIILALVVVPQARITVFAHTQPISRGMQIAVDQNIKEADPTNLSIPGRLIDQDEDLSKDFNTIGKKDVGVKAEGSVQIYNYTGKTLKFNASTTTLSVGQKTYHLQKDVTGIKPTKNLSTGNADAASLTAPVAIIADGSGESYNLPAGTRFEIHNQVLGDAPKLLYAISPVPTTGGITRLSSVITQEDIDAATADLKQSVLNVIKRDLDQQNLTLLDSSAKIDIKQLLFDKSVGDGAVSFRGSISAHIKALVFDGTVLRNIVMERVSLTLDSSQSLILEKTQLDLSYKDLDLEKGAGVVVIKFQGSLVSNLDKNKILSIARGKSPSDLQELLLSDAKIDDLTIDLSPIWAKTVPTLPQRIKVEIRTK